jgi:hypothetical protein
MYYNNSQQYNASKNERPNAKWQTALRTIEKSSNFATRCYQPVATESTQGLEELATS